MMRGWIRRFSLVRFNPELYSEATGLIAGKPAPTRFSVNMIFVNTTPPVGAWLARDDGLTTTEKPVDTHHLQLRPNQTSRKYHNDQRYPAQ
jgi:hypothetical protein